MNYSTNIVDMVDTLAERAKAEIPREQFPRGEDNVGIRPIQTSVGLL